MISGILFVLAGTAVMLQFGYYTFFVGSLASGKVTKASAPLWPTWAATVLAIVAVVLL